MKKNIATICAEENARAVDLDREAAKRQKMLREAYENACRQDKRTLSIVNDFTLALISHDKSSGFYGSEKERQNQIVLNQKDARRLRDYIKNYERCLKTGKYDFVEGTE